MEIAEILRVRNGEEFVEVPTKPEPIFEANTSGMNPEKLTYTLTHFLYNDKQTNIINSLNNDLDYNVVI